METPDLIGDTLALHGVKSLEHYGVPGMKWGRRKSRGGSHASTVPTDVTIKSRPGKIETSGGKNQMPHDDAKKAAGYRQKAKSSGVHALSNVELKSLVERMNLEANYAKALAANAPPKGFIQKFIAEEQKALMGSKKTKTQGLVELIVGAEKKRRGVVARKATQKAASVVVGRAIEGVVK